MSLQFRRIGLVILSAVVASAACAYVGFRIVGWLGVAIVGLVTVLVAVQVDMDAVAPVADAQNTGLFASVMAARGAESRAERAERLAQGANRRRVLRLAKVLGTVMAIVGAIGFFMVQLHV